MRNDQAINASFRSICRSTNKNNNKFRNYIQVPMELMFNVDELKY